ncbi:MAG: hypothetical protein RSE12_15125 [Fuscovulum sp.]|nr:MAG: hypothetical protein RSE12_15125 [Fuscovulum sp.]
MKEEQSTSTNSEIALDEITTEQDSVHVWRQRLRKMVWPLHAAFPNTVPSPYGDETDYFLELDKEENAKSQIEDGVSLRLACIMVTELFGPNEIDSLYESLERIGWDQDGMFARSDSNVEWLKAQRLYGAFGYLPLGRIIRASEAKSYHFVRYTADFPREFSSLLVNISQLTPSTTCLSVGFVLADNVANEYASAINAPARTVRVPKRRFKSYSIKGAEHVKRERVRNIRRKYLKLGVGWVSKNFPGYFSASGQQGKFPTAEFLSLDGFTAFERDAERKRNWLHWSRFLNIEDDLGSWVCTSVPSLRFSFEHGYRDDLPNHMTIALRWDDLSESEKDLFQDDSLFIRTFFAREKLGGIIARFALASYLRELLRYLKETQQSLSFRSKPHRSTSQIDRISAFFSQSIGVPMVAREVLALSQNDASFQWNATGFTRKTSVGKEIADIKDGLKSLLAQLSKRLLEEDRDTRELLNQLSSAIGTRESVLAQGRMEFIARVALAVAVASLIAAAVTIFK